MAIEQNRNTRLFLIFALDSGEMKIVSVRFCKFLPSSQQLSNFRYNLAKANLDSVVKYGDTCQVEYKIQPKKEDSEFTDELLVVKKVYFGPKLDKPVRPAHNSSFSVYLSNRGVDETRFMQWVILYNFI